MTITDLIPLVASLTTATADWQRAASKGRGTVTAEAKAQRAAKRLLAAVTGEEPSDQQVGDCVRNVGMM